MADEAKEAFEESMRMVERLAVKIAEMPIEQRPEGYLVVREALVEAAKEMKLEDAKLDEFVNHTMSGIETLVREIEAGGRAGRLK